MRACPPRGLSTSRTYSLSSTESASTKSKPCFLRWTARLASSPLVDHRNYCIVVYTIRQAPSEIDHAPDGVRSARSPGAGAAPGSPRSRRAVRLRLLRPVYAEGVADLHTQIVVVPRFGEEFVDRALVDRLGHGAEIGVAAQHHAHRARMHVLDLAQQLGAGGAGHALIRDDDADLLAREEVHGVLGGSGGEDAIAVATQRPGERIEHVRLVVHQQQRLRVLLLRGGVVHQIAVTQQVQRLARRHRLAEVETLERVAVVAPQVADLGAGLHAL